MFERNLRRSYEKTLRWAKAHKRVEYVDSNRLRANVHKDKSGFDLHFTVLVYAWGGLHGIEPFEPVRVWSKKRIMDASEAENRFWREINDLRSEYASIQIHVTKTADLDGERLAFDVGDNSYDERLDCLTIPPFRCLGWL